MTTTTSVCRCGHEARQHIYEEGACRPGWPCNLGCTQFRQTTSPQDEAGSYLSPGGSNGGVLAGAPSALQVRVKRAIERYEDATYYATYADRHIAINELLDELRLIASARPPMFTDRAEYERYTTLMEQAEERKS